MDWRSMPATAIRGGWRAGEPPARRKDEWRQKRCRRCQKKQSCRRYGFFRERRDTLNQFRGKGLLDARALLELLADELFEWRHKFSAIPQQGTMRSRLRTTRRVALRVSTTIFEPSTIAL